jgi:hypothetical protein
VSNLTSNIGHIVTSVIIIAAVLVLALFSKITGAEALTVIVAVGGVSLGGSVASSSAGNLVSASHVVPALTPTSITTSSTATPATPEAVFPSSAPVTSVAASA